MGEQIKYLVEIRCQPLSNAQVGQMARELSGSFPVKQCRANQAGLTIELISSHLLAYGTLKDLADLIERSLSRQGAQLQSGVINQAVPGPMGAAVKSLVKALERRALARPLLIGLQGRFAERLCLPARPVPVMYFYRGLGIDLMLAGKLKRTSTLELAAELN